MRKTLFAIFAFIAFTLGSFIWFIATWDAEAEEPVGNFFWPALSPEARDLAAHPTAALTHIGATT